jgi:hypothetical protein
MERVRLDVAPLLPQIQMASTTQEDFRIRLRAAELATPDGRINRKLIVDAFFEKGGKFSEAYEKKEHENYPKKCVCWQQVRIVEISQGIRKIGERV